MRLGETVIWKSVKSRYKGRFAQPLPKHVPATLLTVDDVMDVESLAQCLLTLRVKRPVS